MRQDHLNPQKRTASGHTVRPRATTRSQEKGVTDDPNRSSYDVFDRHDQDRRKDMRTHLDARRASATSRRRQEEVVVSPINDEINELRARLEKLAARNTEAAQSMSTSPFSVEIQQAPLPVGFRMPTMVAYEGKADPLCNTPFTLLDTKPVKKMLLAFKNIITKFPYKFFIF